MEATGSADQFSGTPSAACTWPNPFCQSLIELFDGLTSVVYKALLCLLSYFICPLHHFKVRMENHYPHFAFEELGLRATIQSA